MVKNKGIWDSLAISTWSFWIAAFSTCKGQYGLFRKVRSSKWLAHHLRDLASTWRLIPACVLSHFSRAFTTPWTVARQAPLSMGFSSPEYWSGLPFPSPGDVPNPGIDLTSLMSPALAAGFFTTSTTWEAQVKYQNGTWHATVHATRSYQRKWG